MINITDINFLPLDLPVATIDPEKIKNFMDKNGSRTNYDWTKKINDPWNHVIVRRPELPTKNNEIPGSGWRSDFRKKFSEVVDLVEKFPYKNINYVYILEQIIDVDPHFDYISKNPNNDLEPATYRINMLMEDSEAFYICSDVECTNKINPTFPTDTNSWVFSNKKFMHGSKMPTNNLRKILLAVSGDLDSEKHFALLNKSCQKYHKYIF